MAMHFDKLVLNGFGLSHILKHLSHVEVTMRQLDTLGH